jgi:hypothetical protein
MAQDHEHHETNGEGGRTGAVRETGERKQQRDDAPKPSAVCLRRPLHLRPSPPHVVEQFAGGSEGVNKSGEIFSCLLAPRPNLFRLPT